MILKLRQLLQIDCIVNCIDKYSERLVSDEEDWNIINENMLKKFDEPNKVERIVSRYKLNNEDRLNLIDAVEIQDFPKLDLQSIKRYLTLGYFCANCNQYFYENFDLEVSKDNNNNLSTVTRF